MIASLRRFDAVLFFFFSSRRRHTRLVSDWSSDVCSSDLQLAEVLVRRGDEAHADADRLLAADADDLLLLEHAEQARLDAERQVGHLVHEEIGRASCRERGEMSGGAGAVEKERSGDADRNM